MLRRKPKRYFLTYLWTLPYDVLTWVILFAIWILWGKQIFWLEGVWIVFKEDSWPTRTWYKGWGGTTFGHGGILSPGYEGSMGIDTEVEYHEHVHTRQYEMIMLAGFISSVAVSIYLYVTLSTISWIPFFLWNASWHISYLASLFQSYLRGTNPYRMSAFEESAYALAREWERKKTGI